MDVRRLTATLLVIPLFGLLACGSSDPADPATSSPLPTPSSSSPTHIPPKPETVEHFIRRYYEVERRMEVSGKTAEYAALTHRCAACNRLVRHVESIYAHGGYIRWKGLSVLSVKRYGREGDGTPIFEVKSDSTPTRYRESASSPERRIKGGVSRVALAIDRLGLTWRVNGGLNLS